jgi:hypothetical protein
MVTEEQIPDLVTRGLLRPKAEVGWRPAAGEEFPTEGIGETIIFLAHIERGFGVPTSDFFRSLLFFYQNKLVHLVLIQSPSFPRSSTCASLPQYSTTLPLVAPLL